MNKAVLLDTHTILWWKAGGQRLSRRAQQELTRSDTLLVSPISCWEITVLVRRGRVELDRDVFAWVRDLLDEDEVELAALGPQAAVRAGAMAGEALPGDPADRFLYATAWELGVDLITKDRKVRDFAKANGTVRCVW